MVKNRNEHIETYRKKVKAANKELKKGSLSLDAKRYLENSLDIYNHSSPEKQKELRRQVEYKLECHKRNLEYDGMSFGEHIVDAAKDFLKIIEKNTSPKYDKAKRRS